MVSIENLGDNIVNMSNELCLWRENDAMEAEEEFAVLTDPVSLLEPVKSSIETMNLLSSAQILDPSRGAP